MAQVVNTSASSHFAAEEKSLELSGLGLINSATTSSVTAFLFSWMSKIIGVMRSISSFFRKPVSNSPLV